MSYRLDGVRMRHWLVKASKEILGYDIIDKTIDNFIIKERLVGVIPLTVELKRGKKQNG